MTAHRTQRPPRHFEEEEEYPTVEALAATFGGGSNDTSGEHCKSVRRAQPAQVY